MKYYIYFFNLFLVLLVFILQKAGAPSLPSLASNINIALIAIMFSLIVFSFEQALFWVFALGFLFDLYSFFPFGVYTISYLSAMLAMYSLSVGYFTDKSLYSLLILGLAGTIAFELMLHIASIIIPLFSARQYGSHYDMHFLTNELVQLCLNSALVIFGFYFFNFFTRRLKPVFIIRKK